MPEFTIPVTITMDAEVNVEADTAQQAQQLAERLPISSLDVLSETRDVADPPYDKS